VQFVLAKTRLGSTRAILPHARERIHGFDVSECLTGVRACPMASNILWIWTRPYENVGIYVTQYLGPIMLLKMQMLSAVTRGAGTEIGPRNQGWHWVMVTVRTLRPKCSAPPKLYSISISISLWEMDLEELYILPSKTGLH
jgi:hypothetical protein